MCVLCGALASNFHWSVIKNSKNECEVGEFSKELTRSRYLRIAILNEIINSYSLELKAWYGSSCILSDKKGNSLIIDDLANLWQGVEELGFSIDILDKRFIDG